VLLRPFFKIGSFSLYFTVGIGDAGDFSVLTLTGITSSIAPASSALFTFTLVAVREIIHEPLPFASEKIVSLSASWKRLRRLSKSLP